MEHSEKPVFSDTLLISGVILIILSAFIYMLPEIDSIHLNMDSWFGLFFVNYAIALAYMVTLLIRGFMIFRWAVFKANITYTILLLVLFFISAFSLNMEVQVFDKTVPWAMIYILVQCCALILLSFQKRLPSFLNYLLYVILGAGIPVYIYYAVYLFPYYIIGVLGSIFFGISLHVFVPLFFILFSILIFFKGFKINKKILYPFLCGLMLPLIYSMYFLWQWNSLVNRVNFILNETIISETDLPAWVKLSQQLTNNALTEKLLKTELVYSTPVTDGFLGWRFPQISFDETRKHDPLVMMASFFLGKPDLGETDKIKILESLYDSRHQAEERLWSGDMLETSNVISNVRIYPEYRIAYTEKILSIRNKNRQNRARPQEAIYNFHLPEGSVITSLSLWINGIEEKGILTTKSKADSAYKTIVGVEQRDPSVVHWQEGNTVTVRIFPCTPKENRRFKIGITSPLKKNDEKLLYRNIYFDGPDPGNATESIRVQFTDQPSGLSFSIPNSIQTDNSIKTDGIYDAWWEINFDALPVLNDAFSFDGNSYQISDYRKQYKGFNPETFYLDLNSSWQLEELKQVYGMIKEYKAYVFTGEFVNLNSENIGQLYDQLAGLNFSLFPFNKIPDTSQAIVISKSPSGSPNLKELTGSPFAKNLTNYLANHNKIKLFDLGNSLSPFLKTLKELHVFDYDHGGMSELQSIIKERKFISSSGDDSTIVIDDAEMMIRRNLEEIPGKAPDHLMRLFCYNNIMKKISENYFDAEFISAESITEAQKAYIVTPISSLVVLETKKDYERFGINDENKSLKNASLKSSGVVPEPHEWLLIMVTVVVVLFLLSKSYIKW